MSYAYRLAALKIESDLALPDLSPWDGSGISEPDISFRLGAVPPRLHEPDHSEAIFQTRGRDEYLLVLPGTGRILVRHGRQVTVELEHGADPINTRALLTGPIQAVLWHQRGLVPLHANAVVIGGRAVALAGTAAAGKSALAATLARDGHQPLADNLCVLDDAGKTAPAMVLPGVALLRLWRDTIEHLATPADGMASALSGRDRFLVDRWSACREPRALAAVIVLVRRSSVALTIERLSGITALGALRDMVQMRRPASALGRSSEILGCLTRLLVAAVPVWRLQLPDDVSCLSDAAAEVLGALEQP